MSTALSTLEKSLHPAAAGVAALIGTVGGGVIFVSLSGAVLGLVSTLGALGIAAVVLSLLGWLNGGTVDRERAPAAMATTNVAAVASAAGGEVGGNVIEPTATEAEILAAGRFAEFHLAKAKRMLADGNFKDAAYQAGASLAHDSLPEAKNVLAAARASMKG